MKEIVSENLKINRIIDSIYRFRNRMILLRGKLNGEFSRRLKKSSVSRNVLHIFSNGPSLNDAIDFVKECPGDIMMMNNMIYQSLFYKYDVKYLCFYDGRYLEDERFEETIAGILRNNSIEVFMSHELYESFCSKYKELQKNVYEVYNGLNRLIYDAKRMKRLYEKNIASPITSTVSIAALYAGIQLGYKTIYLHGNDFSWIKDLEVDENNIVWGLNTHCYDIKSTKSVSMHDMYVWSRGFYEGFLGYYNLAQYAKDEGVKIYNMSVKSYIDVFEKFVWEPERKDYQRVP